MIDLHTHILPGVDDGSKTDEDAIAFARMAVEDGTRTMVATPHCKEGFFFNDRDQVLSSVEAFREVLKREGIPLELLPGAEVHLCPDLAERVKDGRAPTLADNGKTLLLELSLRQYPVELENLIFQLRLTGVEVLFAHPERIRYFRDDPSRFEEVVRLGGYGQVNAGSLRGTFGEETKEYAVELVRKGLVQVIASDAHNCRGRHPQMSDMVESVAGWVGEARATAMVDSIPRAFLEGRTPTIPPVESRFVDRPSFFSRIFGRGR